MIGYVYGDYTAFLRTIS